MTKQKYLVSLFAAVQLPWGLMQENSAAALPHTVQLRSGPAQGRVALGQLSHLGPRCRVRPLLGRWDHEAPDETVG